MLWRRRSTPQQSVSDIIGTLYPPGTVIESTLVDASRQTGASHPKDAATVALDIARIVQSAESRGRAFRPLARDSCIFVYNIARAGTVAVEAAAPSSSSSGSESLAASEVSLLREIHSFVEKQLSRKTFVRILLRKSETKDVNEYRSRLQFRAYLRQLQSTLSLRDQLVATCQELVNVQSAIAKAWSGPTEALDQGTPQMASEPSNSRPNLRRPEIPSLSSPRPPSQFLPDQFSAFHGFHSLDRTPGLHDATPLGPTVIHGEQNRHLNSVISVSIGNITTRVTSNSNNDFSRINRGKRVRRK